MHAEHDWRPEPIVQMEIELAICTDLIFRGICMGGIKDHRAMFEYAGSNTRAIVAAQQKTIDGALHHMVTITTNRWHWSCSRVEIDELWSEPQFMFSGHELDFALWLVDGCGIAIPKSE